VRRFAFALPLAAVCLFGPVLAQTSSAQVFLTAPKYHDNRPTLCVRSSFLGVSTRNCVYPDNTFAEWTDQDGGAVLVAFDNNDGNGLTFTDDGLSIFGIE
jgi:hypothetical protein